MNDKVSRIGGEFTTIEDGVKELVTESDGAEGMLVLLTDRKGGYKFYVAGHIWAESTISRLEIIKHELLKRIT